MKPLYVRELTKDEEAALRQGLKSEEGFTVRRAQMLLLSACERLKVEAIGERIGCTGQAVRQAIHAFHQRGLSALQRQSRARQDEQRAFNDDAREGLRELIQSSPRAFGYDTSLWTLALLATVSYEQGLTVHRVHKDTVSETLRQMGLPWKRAKKTIYSPDPNYDSKKNGAIG